MIGRIKSSASSHSAGRAWRHVLHTSSCDLHLETCSSHSASRSSLHQLLSSSPRIHPLLFWCGRCSEPYHSSKRRAPLRNSPQLGSESVSGKGGAKEGNLSARQSPRLLPSRVSCAGVAPRLDNYPYARFRGSSQYWVSSTSVESPMRQSLWRACCEELDPTYGPRMAGSPPRADLVSVAIDVCKVP